MQGVLWNSEIDLCVGLIIEMDMEEFIDMAERKYKEITGNNLPDGIFSVTQEDNVWVLGVSPTIGEITPTIFLKNVNNAMISLYKAFLN